MRCRFTAADEQMARELYRRGVSLSQVARAIWLGCARKYATLLSAPDGSPMPIGSSLFAAVIDEVVAHSRTSDTYWSYIRRKAAGLEQEWLRSSRHGAGSVGA